MFCILISSCFQVQWTAAGLGRITGQRGLQRRGDRGYQLPTGQLSRSFHRSVPAPQFSEPAIDQSALHHHDDDPKPPGPRDTLSLDTQATFPGLDSVKRDEADEEDVYGNDWVEAELLPVLIWGP